MEPNTPAAIPWYSSRIIWAQIVGIVFALSSAFGLDLGSKLGMNNDQLIGAILTLVPVITVIIRVVNPTPPVTGTQAGATALIKEMNFMSLNPVGTGAGVMPVREPFKMAAPSGGESLHDTRDGSITPKVRNVRPKTPKC